MYQCVCRAAGFDFLRLRFPHLLAVFRFFYYHAPVIWFGGAILWVLTSASGVSTLASPSTPGARKLVSAEGGIQGDGGATLLAIGPFHETLSRVQRAHPDVAMTGIADDTYSCGLLIHPRIPRHPQNLLGWSALVVTISRWDLVSTVVVGT